MNKIKKVILIIRLALMKREANRLAKRTCRQHFVVAFGGKIRIISKPGFKRLRQRNVFPQSFTAADLKRIALYHTPGRAALHFQKSRKAIMYHLSPKQL